MSVPALRPGSRASSVEALHRRIFDLAHERQTLRADGAGRDDLERNRLELVHAQLELSHALIARYLPPAPARDAA